MVIAVGRFIALCGALVSTPAPAYPWETYGLASSATSVSASACESEAAGAPGWVANAADTRVSVGAQEASSESRCPSGSDSGARYIDYRLPLELCAGRDTASSSRLCVEGVGSEDLVRLCADGAEALDPLVRQPVDAMGQPIGPWVQIDDGCPQDEQPAVVLTVEEFRTLPLTPSVPSFQPASGRGLVNMELIVFTDPAPQVLQTMVLGTPVTVRAMPASFSWDFGDGSEALVTTDPGAPYPEFRVFHVFEQPGSFQVQLTTMWSGQFQVNGQGPWFPVTGTAQTVSPAFAETVVEARSHLVDGPLP